MRYEVTEAIGRAVTIDRLCNEDKTLKRQLTREETEFIKNERVLTQLDFLYWFERYYQQIRDGTEGGGLGRFRLWESQRLLFDLIGRIEEEQVAPAERGEAVDGILLADHKDRQIGHTGFCRALMMHRVTRWPYQRAAAISVDEGKVAEVYSRDLACYENLPWFLRPEIEFIEKHEHLALKDTHSRITYMQANKKSSLGQSSQFDFGHLTELSEYPYPDMIDVDFFATLPQSPMTLCILESRANGRRNWWHEFTEAVRRGRKPRWRYSYIPWYSEVKKYRRTPPAGWEPSGEATAYAQMIHETSPEFMGGRSVYLTREQLYWWESTRAEYYETGKLGYFLTNWGGTPELSFQHSGASAFSPELLLRLQSRVGSIDPRLARGMAYELEVSA